MSKFKVGDLVRIVPDPSYGYPIFTDILLYDNGLVTALKEGGGNGHLYEIHWDNKPKRWFHEDWLELVTEDNNNEEDTMSIQNDIINQNLSDNQEYLLRKGVIDPAGGVASLATLLQVLLAMNEDAVVKYMKEAEAKAEARKAATGDSTPNGN